MAFWAYILRCSDGSYYTGHTDNLDHRFAQHQAGELPGYTHDRRPVELVWSGEFPTREQAISAEFKIKNWSRAKKEALMREDWPALGEAAKPPSRRAVRSLDGRPLSLDRLGTARDERVFSTIPPAIILVRPQLGENIGKAARAMLNFGLTDMRLVAPRDGWPNPDAGPAASGADVVLANARVFATVADAVADCHYVYATTVRKRGLTKPVVTPETAAREMRARPERSALLFGPERSGLETDDVALAQAILTVPVNPDFGSLNLAQAVILAAYEWSKAADRTETVIDNYEGPASQAALEGLVGQVDDALEAAGYYHVPSRVVSAKRTLRNLLTRPGYSEKEVRTLRGVVHALIEGRRGGRPRSGPSDT